EGRSRAGQDVLKTRREDRDAIHLPLDQDGVIQLADGFFGMVEVEEESRIGVDRGFRRVQIFWSGLLIGGERSPRKGDNAAGLVRDRKHDSVAEFGVEGCELRAASFERISSS